MGLESGTDLERTHMNYIHTHSYKSECMLFFLMVCWCFNYPALWTLFVLNVCRISVLKQQQFIALLLTTVYILYSYITYYSSRAHSKGYFDILRYTYSLSCWKLWVCQDFWHVLYIMLLCCIFLISTWHFASWCSTVYNSYYLYSQKHSLFIIALYD